MAQELSPLIERARRGDRAAFGELVRAYQQRVYMTAYRMTREHASAHDISQEVFLRAYRGLGSFDGRSEFFTWLYRIVVNVSLNHLRREGRRRALSLDEVELPEPLQQQAGQSPELQLQLKRQVRDVAEAMDALPETLKTTVILVILDGMSYREAAEALQCTEGTVGWRIHEARKILRTRLDHHLQGAGTGARAGHEDAAGQQDPKDTKDGLSGDTREALDVS